MSTNNSAALGNRLRIERRRIMLTQEMLAKPIGVNRGTVHQWEFGHPIPSDKIIALAEQGIDVVFVILGRRELDGHEPKTLGARLVVVRKHLGLSQKEMCDATGGIFRSWNEYENETVPPSAHVLRALSTRGFNANWLLTGCGKMLLDDNTKEEKQTQPNSSASITGHRQ